jgi:hypothetical protein
LTTKDFEHKVQGWINCDYLELEASRDGIYGGNEIYADFIQKLIQYLDENYDRKFEGKDKDVKSQRQLAKMFVSVVKSIHDLYPEMTKPKLFISSFHIFFSYLIA